MQVCISFHHQSKRVEQVLHSDVGHNVLPQLWPKHHAYFDENQQSDITSCAPPPLCLQVITPLLLRPFFRCLDTTSERSGLLDVTSLKSVTTLVRVPGV